MLQLLLKAKFILITVDFFSNVITLYFRVFFHSILSAAVTSASEREEYRIVNAEISFRVFYRGWLGHWSLLLKRVAASFKRVAAFSNVQQHAEISIIHFTFILILFLPCLCWRYPLFQCVYKSSTLFLYFCYLVFLYMLSSCQYIHICCLRHNSSGSVFWI